MSYGYQNRPPMPDRFVTGGPAVPRSEFPRDLASGIKSSSGGYSPIILFIQDSDNAAGSMLVGNTAITFGNGGNNGTQTISADSWSSEFDRFCYIADMACGHASNTAIWRESVNFEISLKAFLSPDLPAFPGVLRFEDVMAAKSTVTPSGYSGGCGMGVSWEAASPANGAEKPYPFIGFQAEWADPDVTGEWYCVVSDDAGTEYYNAASGSSSDAPHHLAIEFDGVNKQINYYVDDSLVGAYAVGDDSEITAVTSGRDTAWRRYITAKTNTAKTRMIMCCDMQTVVSLKLYDVDET